MTLDITKLKAICEKATPGPWTTTDLVSTTRNWHDAAFIATFNPQVVKAMLAVCEAASNLHNSVGAVWPDVFEGGTKELYCLLTSLAAYDEALK